MQYEVWTVWNKNAWKCKWQCVSFHQTPLILKKKLMSHYMNSMTACISNTWNCLYELNKENRIRCYCMFKQIMIIFFFLVWLLSLLSSWLLSLLTFNSGFVFTFSRLFHICFTSVNRAMVSFINNKLCFHHYTLKSNVLKTETAICRQTIELKIIQFFF